MEQLIKELKLKIIDTLNLEGVTPDDIDMDAQLVGGDLGIDSIDVLEIFHRYTLPAFSTKRKLLRRAPGL